MARRHTEVFLEVLRGEGFARAQSAADVPNPPGLLRLEPYPKACASASGGARVPATAEWAAKSG